MKVNLVLISLFVLLFDGYAQRSIIDGKSCVDFVHVTFKENVIPSEDTTGLFDLTSIDRKYVLLARYLERIGIQVIRKDFPKYKWADTLVVDDYGVTRKRPNMARHFTFYFFKPVPILEVKDSLMQFPFIEKVVGPMGVMPERRPNDEDYLYQWAPEIIRAGSEEYELGAWEITIGNRTATQNGTLRNSIAFIDSKFGDHDDLRDNVRGGEGFSSESGHGTQVAGVACATTDNGNQIAGVGWATMATLFDFTNGTGEAADITAAKDLTFVKVINMSFYEICYDDVWDTCHPCTEAELASTAFESAILNAAAQGKVLVASGGNPPPTSCPDTWYEPDPESFEVPRVQYPAWYSQVIAVSASDLAGNFPAGYNFGDAIELNAPGIDVLTLSGTNLTIPAFGTSFSTPIAGAVAALLFDINPSITGSQVRTILQETAEPLGSPSEFGYGRVDAYRAVREAIPNTFASLPRVGDPLYISTDPSYVNTAVFIKNYDRVNYPPSHATLLNDLTMDNSTLVIEMETWLNCDFTVVSLENGGRLLLEPNAELNCSSPGQIQVAAGSNVSYQGPGACIGLKGGTLSLEDNATLHVGNNGILASFSPSIVNLGNGANLIIESDGVLQWDQVSAWTFGTGSRVDIYGKVQVGNNTQLLFPSSSAVFVYPGAEFLMGDNSKLVIEGRLTVAGTVSDQVTFSLNGTSNWTGIKVNASADVMFNWCEISGTSLPIRIKTPVKATIQNCTLTSPGTGIQIMPDLGQGPAPTHEVNIKDNTIITASSIGISVQDYSDLLIEGNSITGTLPSGGPSAGTGIYCSGASPTILGNTISLFNRAIRCINQSSPVLENGAIGGYNVIHDNNFGVVCDNGSNAVLGLLSQDPDDGGQNSLFYNSAYNVYLTNNSFVNAQNNWWGAAPPDPLKFYEDGTSTLIYEPYLSSYPNGPSSPVGGGPKGTRIASTARGGATAPEMDPLDDNPLMREAITARINGEYLAALRTLSLLIEDEEEPIEIKGWAVSEILANAMHLENNDVSAYLGEVKELQSDLYESVNQALVTVMIDESEVSDAIVRMDSNIVRYPNSVLEATGLYGKFAVALFRDEDLNLAQTYLDALQSSYPRSGERELAQSQMELAQMDGMNKGVSPTGSLLGEQPRKFRLLQNYPNPFNPTTTIEYEVPVDAHVKLKVYDILGREVLTIANEIKQAGNHQVTLDATNLASGMYFYRLTAGSFTDVKKLLVVK